MSVWKSLVHLGDVGLTLPLTLAMVAWLLAARAHRAALWWALLFSAGLGMVALSKIVFMGFGTGVPALGFKALSGHATGASAVLPALFFLALGQCAPQLRQAGVAGGIALALLVGAALVVLREHSVAEVIAGCALGAAVSLASIRVASAGPPAPVWPGLAYAVLAFAVASWLMQSAHIGYWMIRLARLLSGNRTIFSLTFD